MAQELPDQFLEAPDSPMPSSAQLLDSTPPPDSAEPSLSRSSSAGSRLNAQAPEFVPRTSPHPGQNHHHHQQQQHHHHQQQPQQRHHNNHPRYPHHHHQQPHSPHHHQQPPRMMPIHPHAPPPPPMLHVFHPHSGPTFHPPVHVPNHGSFDYYGAGGFVEPEHVQAEQVHSPEPAGGESLSEDVVNKVTKQVEYYFSDLNLATTEHLMKFISKDPEGFVPITVLSPFKKIRALVNNNAHLAAALRTSTKLVVSEDGKKVRRQQPITDSYLDELQSRIVVAENLPEDHCYQNLVKVFSVVGGVKTIRTCYPQNANGSTPTNLRSGKTETFLFNKLHAFVEYETSEQAEKAVADLNDERNWRSGLRVRFLPKSMRHGQGRSRRSGHDGDGNVEEEDASISNLPEHIEDQFPAAETSIELTGEDGFHDRDAVGRRGRGRGRGGRGRGRGQYNNNRNAAHPVGTPPAGQQPQSEQSSAHKPPPGPRMPDGTRGFTMGRGKPTGAPLLLN